MNNYQEKESIASNAAPKVTEQDLHNMIKSEDYVLLPNGRTTVCMLTLVNGYTVTGESSCVCAENYDKEIGDKFAKKKAIDNLWPLAGILLADRLFRKNQLKTWQGRLFFEYSQTKERLEALSTMLLSPPSFMDKQYIALLETQRTAMEAYVSVLKTRIDMALGEQNAN